MNIISLETKAMEFAQAVKETDEYSNLNAAQARIKLDPVAQEIINDLEQTQQRIQQAQAQGQPVNSEVQSFQLLQQKAIANETLKRFFQAQQDFAKVMENANELITKELFGSIG